MHGDAEQGIADVGGRPVQAGGGLPDHLLVGGDLGERGLLGLAGPAAVRWSARPPPARGVGTRRRTRAGSSARSARGRWRRAGRPRGRRPGRRAGPGRRRPGAARCSGRPRAGGSTTGRRCAASPAGRPSVGPWSGPWPGRPACGSGCASRPDGRWPRATGAVRAGPVRVAAAAATRRAAACSGVRVWPAASVWRRASASRSACISAALRTGRPEVAAATGGGSAAGRRGARGGARSRHCSVPRRSRRRSMAGSACGCRPERSNRVSTRRGMCFTSVSELTRSDETGGERRHPFGVARQGAHHAPWRCTRGMRSCSPSSVEMTSSRPVTRTGGPSPSGSMQPAPSPTGSGARRGRPRRAARPSVDLQVCAGASTVGGRVRDADGPGRAPSDGEPPGPVQRDAVSERRGPRSSARSRPCRAGAAGRSWCSGRRSSRATGRSSRAAGRWRTGR